MPDIALSPTQRATEPTVATEGARLEAGTKAGEYVVERFLGAGAMGEVYAGKQPEIGKRVAIKVLRPSLATSAEAAERFKREARVVNQIDHPNVIDVFGFGRLDDGRLYLVMDLVDGETLRAAVQNGPLPVETALDILDQIADALDAAHAKGVVHRDLKPDNVMLSGTPPKVHVLDFGIAKLLATGDAPAQSMLTGQGAWIGTPGYMAPEQWSAEGAAPASDRYALGVMAFELLSGKLPFQASTLPQMMEQHFRAPVPALSTRGAVAARSTFDAVLARAMAKDPDKRFASAKAMVAALRERAGKRAAPSAKKLWAPAVAGVGVLGVAIAGVVAVRGGPERTEEARPSPTSFVQLEVRSNPPGATVMRGDRMYGQAPTKIDARPGERVELTLRKPGFAPAQTTIDARENAAVDVVLVKVSGFQGTWVLPDGQLRAFERSGDTTVDVYKLESLRGEKTFYRKYTLEDSPSGVRFASTELVVDERAPTDPSCQIPVRVEYHYEPAHDALVVRPEDVETGYQNGRCVVHSREVAPPVTLVRADATASDTRISRAPMGAAPIDQPKLRPRISDEERKQQLIEEKNAEQRAAPRKGKKAAAIDAKRLPDPLLGSEPAKNVEPRNSANAPPQQQAVPQPQVGDSQIAPQVKK